MSGLALESYFYEDFGRFFRLRSKEIFEGNNIINKLDFQ